MTRGPVAWPSAGGRLWRDAALITLMLAALLAWDFSGWDLFVSSAFGSPTGFALRDAWWSSRLLHDGGRVLAWGAMAALLLNVWRPWVGGLTRAQRVRWLLISLVCIVIVSSLKRFSATSCPWDLEAFGGVARYVPHWAAGRDGGPGHCFPSGHAVAAFGFIGGWFVLRGHHRRAARLWLAGVLIAAAAFGLAQLVRGAHYLSHTLWSGWLCWTMSWLLSLPWERPARDASHR